MMWLFDGATGAEQEYTFGPWKQDPFSPHVEKLENWPIENGQRRTNFFAENEELNLWWDGAPDPSTVDVSTQNQDGMPMSPSWFEEGGVSNTLELSTSSSDSVTITAPRPEIVVVGQRVYWYVYLGEIPSDTPPNTDISLEPNPSGVLSTQIELIDACPVEKSAANTAMSLLYLNSPTARALIDTMGANGTTLNLITANLTGQGPQAWFDSGGNNVNWDPFVYVEGVNTNGSIYTMAPIMVLAHELVHAGHAGDPAYQLAGSEPLVMQIANQIAAELNEATGSNYDTTRDNHVRTHLRNSTSPTSTLFSIARPGCPG